MRNDTAATAKSQRPENKDPGEVTPAPMADQSASSNKIRIKLPKGLESHAHKSGEKVMHLAEGHHVKNKDGTTSFHMHSLDGESVGHRDVESPETEQSEEANGTGDQGMDGSPYGISQALKGFSA